MVTSQDGGDPLRYALVLTFKATKKQFVYEVLIDRLRIAKGVGVASLKVYCDSQVVVNRLREEYVAKGVQMQQYLMEAKTLAEDFANFDITAIPRDANVEFDAQSKYAWESTSLHTNLTKCAAYPGSYECFNVNKTSD